MQPPDLADLLVNLLAALAVFAFAFALIRVGLLQYFLLAPADAEAVPLLHVLAIVAGGLLGLLLLAALPYGADFRPGRIYAADSPWQVDVLSFLARHALPDGETVRAAAARLWSGGADAATLAGRAGLIIALGAALRGALLWRGWARLRAAAAVLQLACWSALVLHYGVHLLAWGATQLNFWLFALLLLAWQRWRQAPRQAAH
jgi:hypothetical protein